MPEERLDVLDIMRREMPLALRPSSYDPETREAEAVISTGAKVRRRDWDGEWDEMLDVTTTAVRLDRLNSGAQLLDGHMFFGGLDAIIGAVVPGTARIEGGQLKARFKFSRSDKGKRIAADLQDGIPILLSVGYKTHQELRDETTSPPTRRAIDWEPYEVSVATIPAEAGVGFRSLFLANRAQPEQQEGAMPDDDAKKKADEAAAAAAAEEAKKKEEDEKAKKDAENKDSERKAEAALRSRIEIEVRQQMEQDAARRREQEAAADKARAYSIEMLGIARQANLPVQMVEEAMTRNVSPTEFRNEVIKRLAADTVRISGVNGGEGGGVVEVGQDNQLTGRAAAMAEALSVRVLSARRMPAIRTQEQAEWADRMGKRDEVGRAMRVIDGKEKPQNERATEYLGRGFAEIAAECLGFRGNIRTPKMAEDIIRRAYHATADFPAIFENVLNKSLLARYQLALPTYRQLAVERPFQDFRPHPQIRTGEMPIPLPLTETGELQGGTSTESKETVSIVPYGRIFSISRQMVVNDEMGAIDQILGSVGDVVLIFENTTFFVMFNSNPTLLQDSTAVFHDNHNNLFDPGSPPSVDSIGAGRAAIRQHKSLSGLYLNIPPRTILAGPLMETKADQMVTAITPQQASNVNPFSGRLNSISDANITDHSWYLICDPALLPNFVYGFLAGATGPRIRTDEPFGVQGIRVSLEHDFGCGAIDFRGITKNVGTGTVVSGT